MYKIYLDIFKQNYKQNNKIYNFKYVGNTLGLTTYIIELLSTVITPFFIYLKFSANLITGINFLIAIVSLYLIFIAEQSLYPYGIILFFVALVLDCCDGSIARYYKQSNFYGRFLDAIVGIFHTTFLNIAIHYFCYKIYSNETLFLLGLIVSTITIYKICIPDKYSSLVRWCNEENKRKIKPYLGKTFYPGVYHILYDFYLIGLLASPLFIYEEKNLTLLLYALAFFNLVMSTMIISKYVFFARKNLSFFAKDK